MCFLGEVEVTGSVADGIAPVPTGEQAPHGVNVNVLNEVHAKHCLIVSSGQSSPNTHRHQTVTIEHMFGWGLLVPLSSFGTKLAEFEQLCSRSQKQPLPQGRKAPLRKQRKPGRAHPADKERTSESPAAVTVSAGLVGLKQKGRQVLIPTSPLYCGLRLLRW